MAKPSWVSVSPQQSSGNATVSVGVTANGGQASRNGTLTLTGTVPGGGTITKTITINQAWGATLRSVYAYGQSGYGIQVRHASVEDNQDLTTAMSGAEKANVSYPFMGGSNICHYHCTKENGVFYFELNTIYIDDRDDFGNIIDAEYWDVANAFFCPLANSGQTNWEYFTPVIRFNYNPSTQHVAVTDTLYSLGGTLFETKIGSSSTPGGHDVVPDSRRLLGTGMVGWEDQGYGALCCTYFEQGESGQTNITWPFHHWYPRFTFYKSHGEKELVIDLVAKTCGSAISSPDSYPSALRLQQYSWASALEYQNKYILTIEEQGISQALQNLPSNNMSGFYHPSMYVVISS